jgi:hypothetical protein
VKTLRVRFAVMLATAAVVPMMIYGAVSIYSLRIGTRASLVDGNLNVARQVGEQRLGLRQPGLEGEGDPRELDARVEDGEVEEDLDEVRIGIRRRRQHGEHARLGRRLRVADELGCAELVDDFGPACNWVGSDTRVTGQY